MRHGRRQFSGKPRRRFTGRLAAVIAVGMVCFATRASAVVVISDGFGDADLDNNGVALERYDVDVNAADTGPGAAGDSWEPVQSSGADTIFADGVMVQEVTAVENASDRGIPWYFIAGFTSATPPAIPDPKVNAKIINDAAAFLPDANPAIGFSSTNTPGQVTVAAIDDGLAMAIESKGRNSQAAAFFDENYQDGNQGRISLGPQAGDKVRVSFDFRVWMSAPNFNTSAATHIPTETELRFGLYQDTDSQLGQTNPTAGFSGGPAVWGQDGGLLRGDGGPVGSGGDHGWFARVPIEDPDETDPTFKPLPNGADARIAEELNVTPDNPSIMNGTQDSVAVPDQTTPNFVNLSYRKVYNLSLTLERIDDAAGMTVQGTLGVVDRATSQAYSLSGFDALDEINPANDPDGGFESDFWDYFVIGLSGSLDDFDWIIDNFKVDVIGSNEPAEDDADFDGDGDVDGADFLTWQRGLGMTGQPQSAGDADGNGTINGADLTIWRNQFGQSSVAAAGAIPEPGAGMLAAIGLLGALARRARNRR